MIKGAQSGFPMPDRPHANRTGSRDGMHTDNESAAAGRRPEAPGTAQRAASSNPAGAARATMDKARTWMRRLSSATASSAHAAQGPATGSGVQRRVRFSDVKSVIAALHSMSAPPLQRFEAAFGSRLDSVVTSVADELSRLALAFHVRLQAEVERRKAGATASGQSASDPAWGGFSPAGSEQSRLTTPEARAAWAKRVVNSVNAGAQAAQPQNEAIRELFADLRENIYGLGSREAFTEKYKKQLGAEFWASSNESEQLYKALAKECSKQMRKQETKPTVEQETKPNDKQKSKLLGILELLLQPNPTAQQIYEEATKESEKMGRDLPV